MSPYILLFLAIFAGASAPWVVLWCLPTLNWLGNTVLSTIAIALVFFIVRGMAMRLEIVDADPLLLRGAYEGDRFLQYAMSFGLPAYLSMGVSAETIRKRRKKVFDG